MPDSRGQSETLGLALILGLTLITVTALAIVGGTALDSAQQQIGTQSAEHAMSQFDSKVAMVGLGRSDAQSVSFGNSQEGTYSVEPGTGWIRISHYNYTASDNETIYNRSLGSVLYQNGETEIAYQGGGVWRKRGNGSVMVSPPEFHYRGATLTLPVLRVSGQGSVSGSPTATVREINRNNRIYPSNTTYAGSTQLYQNPIGEGRVTVTVQSDYYKAWADYFRGRTDGNVSVDHANETATMELIALGTYGDFDMPLDGNSMTLRGVRTHQIEKFSITLFDDTSDNAKFSNLEWSLWASSGSKEWEMHVEPATGSADDGDPAEVLIYYSEGGEHEGWYTDSAFYFEEENTTDWNNDGDYDDKRLVINLTSTDNITYTDLSSGDKPQVYNNPDPLKEPATFSDHVAWEPRSYNESDEESVHNVTNHYLTEMGPEIDIYVEDKSSDTVQEDISYGTVEYGGESSFFLTYLHVTENNVSVSVR